MGCKAPRGRMAPLRGVLGGLTEVSIGGGYYDAPPIETLDMRHLKNHEKVLNSLI